jgi:aspartate carbamoyltransferase catalytic subunit
MENRTKKQNNRQKPTPQKRHHVLDLDDFSEGEIQSILADTAAMSEILGRDIKKVPTLRGKSIATMFMEPSTRTKASFEQAAKILSSDVISVGVSGSSSEKGESAYNTALTLQAMGIDLIVIRHPLSGTPNFLARHLNASVINAGDGSHAHPTQALLDLYTINSNLGKVRDLRVVIVGDILYSRVARSNLWGLTKMGAHVVLCGPRTLMPSDFIANRHVLDNHPFKSVTVEHSIDRALEGADVVIALRLQLERQSAGHLPSLKEYSKMYCITSKRLRIANPDVLVMHPGPLNEGVEIDPEVAHGANSVIESQVANGLAVRMALLYRLIAQPGLERRLKS